MSLSKAILKKVWNDFLKSIRNDYDTFIKPKMDKVFKEFSLYVKKQYTKLTSKNATNKSSSKFMTVMGYLFFICLAVAILGAYRGGFDTILPGWMRKSFTGTFLWICIGVGIIIAIGVIVYRKKWFGPGSVSGSKTPQWPLIGVLIAAGIVLVLYFLLPQLRSTIPDYASTGTGNYQPPAPPPLQVACAECIPYGEHTLKKGVEYKIDYRSRIRFVQRDTGLLRLSLWMDTPQGSSGCDYVSYRTTTGLYDTVIHPYGLLGSGRLPEGIYTVKLYTAEEKLMQDDVVVRFERLH